MSRLMYALMAGVVLIRLGVLGYSAVTLDRSLNREAEARIASTLDVLSEHSLKVLQGADVLIYTVDLMTRGFSDAEVRAREPELHDVFQSIVRRLPDLQSIWLVAPDGAPLVSNAVSPMPKGDLSDRDYFRAFQTGAPDVYIGQVLSPRLNPGNPFFTVSRGRPTAAGARRLIDASLLPSVFVTFFSHLDPEAGLQFSLLRADGALLARYPRVAAPDPRPAAQSDLARLIAAHPAGGIYRKPDAADPFERLVGFRKLDGFPVYVASAIDPAAIRAAWIDLLKSYLLFGAPATFVILLLLFVAFRRTLRMYAEADARKAAEAALGRVQRLDALGQLTGGVAHDFNNLLTVVIGGVELLRDQVADPFAARALDMIEGAARRGESLTRQLLTFSRRQALAAEVFDLGERVARFQDVLGRSLRGDVTVVLDLPAGRCMVKVDPGEFELALLNLAVNARDAMPDGGRLTVAVRALRLDGGAETEGLRGAFVAVSVADTGCGIPADVLARVFDPFFTTKAVGKGTGLGLSQVYGFARQSGGATTIESAPGSGTTATMLLPASAEPPPPVAAVGRVAAAAPPPSPEHAAEARRRVLVVEDDPAVAAVCRRFLEGFGFDVAAAADAAAALDAMRQNGRFDLVMSDIVMPGGMNGIDLARELRRRHPQLPVLLATGFSASADQAIADGFIILRKPYDSQRLRAAVDAALRQPGPAVPQ